MPSHRLPLLLYLSSVQQQNKQSFPSLDLQGLQAALPGLTLARQTRLASDSNPPASCLPELGVKARHHNRPDLGTKSLPHLLAGKVRESTPTHKRATRRSHYKVELT